MNDNPKWAKLIREFDAPIETVWAMWTDPNLFKKWYGPMGMTVPDAQMDVKVGGVRKVSMEMRRPDQTMTMWFIGVYKEVKQPTRLVYTESMCQEDGTIISPESMGMPAGAPDITEVIVDLRVKDGKTEMTMVHVGVPAGSPGESGWTQAIEKLSQITGTAG